MSLRVICCWFQIKRFISEIVLQLPLKIVIPYFEAFFVFFWNGTLQNVVRLLHKLHENSKWKPFSTAPGAVYRSIDGTCVANQIARLRDSRSLRYANCKQYIHTYIHTYIQPLFLHDKNIKANKLVGSCTNKTTITSAP